MMSDDWLKETILEMKTDIKDLSARFSDFMNDRRRTCPTAAEIEKADEKKTREETERTRQRTIKWAIISVAVTLVIGIPAWLGFLGK